MEDIDALKTQQIEALTQRLQGLQTLNEEIAHGISDLNILRRVLEGNAHGNPIPSLSDDATTEPPLEDKGYSADVPLIKLLIERVHSFKTLTHYCTSLVQKCLGTLVNKAGVMRMINSNYLPESMIECVGTVFDHCIASFNQVRGLLMAGGV